MAQQGPPGQDAAPAPELVDRAVSKFLRRMLPILVLMLLVNQMDRTNVGFVQDELRADVGVSATAYGLGAGPVLHRLRAVRGAEQHAPGAASAPASG